MSPRLQLIDAPRLGDEEGVAAVREAAASHSSFYLGEHGATAEVARLLELSRRLFALPEAARERVAARGAQAGGYHGGDRSAPVFVANRAGPELEAVFGDNRWPEQLPELAGAVSAYLDAMYAIAMDVLASVARGLELPADHFEPSFGERAVQNLQVRRFYAGSGPATPLDAHADPPPITLIAQDAVGGLDSLCQGRWIPVHPRDGTLVVQFGELMAAWTADRYPANVHRVRAGETPRHSLVYNLLPRPDALVACVPSCRPPHEPPGPPITVEAFLRTYLRRAVAYSPDALASAGRTPAAGAGLPEAILARCREAVRRSSPTSALKSVSQADAIVRVELAVAGVDVVLEVSRAASDRRYYQRVGLLGFSYRGQIQDDAVLRALDAVLPALADVLADSF